MEVDRVGVHVTHCCLRHGCKYSFTNKACPVAQGEVKQQYRCEYCDMDWEENGKPECAAMGCTKPGYWKWQASGITGVAMVALKSAEFYFCDGHDEWHRNPEWKFGSKPLEKRML